VITAYALVFGGLVLLSGKVGGLVLGGVLTTSFGWALVMFINVRIGLVVLVGILLLVPEAQRSRARLDIGGALASTTAMAAMVYGLITAASPGWRNGWVAGSFALAIAGLVALVMIEHHDPSPMVPPALFTTTRSAAPLLAMLLIPPGQFGFLYLATLFTQNILGYARALMPRVGTAVIREECAFRVAERNIRVRRRRFGAVGTISGARVCFGVGVAVGSPRLCWLGPDSRIRSAASERLAGDRRNTRCRVNARPGSVSSPYARTDRAHRPPAHRLARGA
jgi:hypothetical protein